MLRYAICRLAEPPRLGARGGANAPNGIGVRSAGLTAFGVPPKQVATLTVGRRQTKCVCLTPDAALVCAFTFYVAEIEMNG